MRKLVAVLTALVSLTALMVIAMRQDGPTFEVRKLPVGDPPPGDEFYPPSPANLPTCTDQSLEECLSDYEKLLHELGMDLETCLQKGLSDKELDAIEKTYNVKLSRDIRLLYKWHNGTPNGMDARVFPSGRFLPLDYSLASKNMRRVNSRDPRVKQWVDEMLAFQKSWIEIIMNDSGDGLFFDPERIDQPSSLFHHCHDDVSYDFYPCLANYIASLLELHRSGHVDCVESRIEVTYQWSYDEETAYVNRFGRRVE